MPDQTFIPLDGFLLPPLASSAVAALLVLGCWRAGDLLAAAARPGAADPLWRCLCFGAATAALAGLVHALALLSVATPAVLRAPGAAIGILGLWQVARLWTGAAAGRRLPWPRERWDRAVAVLAAVVLGGLIVAALGPPTDADSLDYHLGVPLEWLRHAGAVADPDWMHARLVGLGESLGLLGLACGSDVLGAAFQAAGMVVACHVACAFAQTPRERWMGVLLVVATPLLVFLVPNQKPQLLPAVLLALGPVAVARETLPRRGTLAAAAVCVTFAIACKHSFVLTGSVAAAAILWMAWRAGAARFALFATAIAGLLLPGQLYLRNLLLYGDPLTPFLERFRVAPDPLVVAFAGYLREFNLPAGPAGMLTLPLDLVLTTEPHRVSSILGVGVLAVLLVVRSRAAPRVLLACALAAAALVVALGQVSPRFFLEAYLWIAALAAPAPWTRAKRALRALLLVQGSAVAAMAAYGAGALGPGMLGDSLREAVMRRTADGAAAAHWLDEVLPAGAVLFTSVRSKALLTRRHAPIDALEVYPADATGRRWLGDALARRRVDTVAVPPPEYLPPAIAAVHGCRGRVLGRRAFVRATRNPFARAHPIELVVFQLDPGVPGCRIPVVKSDRRQ